VVNIIKASPSKKLQFKIERGQKIIQITATPEATKENNQTIGRIGAGVKLDKEELDKLLIKLNYSPLVSLQKAIAKTWETAIFSLKMLGKMLTGQVSLKGISGPVTIATFAGESANLGLKTFLGFLALVSISIGVLNLLPIPVLDGGHLMYYMLEILKGSPVSEKAMLAGQKIGFALLGLLMTIALFNDFNRLIAG
jgi:regulator of sigma E protease